MEAIFSRKRENLFLVLSDMKNEGIYFCENINFRFFTSLNEDNIKYKWLERQ